MSRPPELKAFYEGWATQHRRMLDSIRPLTPDQMQLRAAPREWAIWQLASNMARGRLYWLCAMLGEDDRGTLRMFAGGGWEDDPGHPRPADEILDALEKTWCVAEACLDRWSLDDLRAEVTAKDFWGKTVTITPGWVLWRLMAHDMHHGSEISLILRVHGLPTALNM